MLKQRQNCSLCEEDLMGNAFYCCDLKKYVCVYCSIITCIKCKGKRSTILEMGRKKSATSTKIERNRCCNCRLDQVAQKSKFFFEDKCKMQYCRRCIIFFYSKYCSAVNFLEKQSVNSSYVQVKLRCECQIQKKKIIAFIQRYCYDCSNKIEGPFTVLKNGCRIKKRCLDYLEESAQRALNSQKQHQKSIQDWHQIKEMLIPCQNCREVFDGDKVQLAEKIGKNYLCKGCRQRPKQQKPPSMKIADIKVQMDTKLQRNPIASQSLTGKLLQKIPSNKMQPQLRSSCHTIIKQFQFNQCECSFCFENKDSDAIFKKNAQKSKINPQIKQQNAKHNSQANESFNKRSQQTQKIQNLQISNNKADEFIKGSFEIGKLPNFLTDERINMPSLHLCLMCQQPKPSQEFKDSAYCKECQEFKCGFDTDQVYVDDLLVNICKVCRRWANDQMMNKVKNTCKDCQMKMAETDLKQKKKNFFKLARCQRCLMILKFTQKQGEQIKCCQKCIANAKKLKIFCHVCQENLPANKMMKQRGSQGKCICKSCYKISQRYNNLYPNNKIQAKDNKGKQKQKGQTLHSGFDEKICKICFNSDAVMINKVCRHLMICGKCYSACRSLH